MPIRTPSLDLALTLSPTLARAYRYHYGVAESPHAEHDIELFETFPIDFESWVTALPSQRLSYNELWNLFDTLRYRDQPTERALCAQNNWLYQTPGHIRVSYKNTQTWRYYYYADYDTLLTLLKQERSMSQTMLTCLLSAPAFYQKAVSDIVRDMYPIAEDMNSNALTLLSCVEYPFSETMLSDPQWAPYIMLYCQILDTTQRERLGRYYSAIPFNYAHVLLVQATYTEYQPALGLDIEAFIAFSHRLSLLPELTALHQSVLHTNEPIRQLYMCYPHLHRYLPETYQPHISNIRQQYRTYCNILGLANLPYQKTWEYFSQSSMNSHISEINILL